MRTIATLVFITATLNAHSRQICNFEKEEIIKFSKVENLDNETSRDYSSDIQVAIFDINNDGSTETVFTTNLMVGGVKCWGDLYAFQAQNSLLAQKEINIRDLHKKADINFREIGYKQWKTSPGNHPHENIYRTCIVFEPFISNSRTYIKADDIAFELKENKIYTACRYR
ncbi:hypothetical protein [Aquipseudomonas alcaligenes]|uniref:hypothetical protein n=1 Tax=Aquipseudomonas alcaligenes TaxID=43263 RepID=UPI003749EA1F